PERLPALYLEFWEAGKFSKCKESSFAVYPSLLDLLQGTEKFYHNYVIRMLEREWKGIYRVLEDEYGVNSYVERMRFNVRRVSFMAQSLTGASQSPAGVSQSLTGTRQMLTATRLDDEARRPLGRK
ncbi:MAG: hypothetical protein JO076_01160, partial [Verrucomicrobia bacterium]|nr:hypothetical protein [Verrucomicrobiota bacterium]